MKKFFVLILILSLIGLATLVQADIFMKQNKHTDAFEMMGKSQPATDTEVTIWMTTDMMRSDTEKQSTIVKLKEKLMIFLNHEQKTITEIPLNFDQLADKMTEKEEEMSAEKKEDFKKFMGK